MSLSYFNEWSCQLWNRWEISQKGAFEWAKKAVELDENDYVSTAILGRIYLFKGEYDRAEYHLRKALLLNPNDPENLIHISTGLVFLGYPEEGYQLYEKLMRLFPSGSDALFACGAFINFEMGYFDEAISLGEKHLLDRGWVDFPAFIAAAYFHLGDHKMAQLHWDRFKKQFSEKINLGQPADDQTALQWMINVNPYRSKTQMKPFWDFLNNGKFQIKHSINPDDLHFVKSQFLKKGNLWSISYDGKEVQLADLKGFHDLLELLSKPYQAIHCSELMGSASLEKGEEVFDEKAKKAYKERILEIQQELEEAESLGNEDYMVRLQNEYDEIIDHLAKSTGKGGKTRVVNDSVEKARTAVTWRIRNAIKKINEVHPSLGKHLKVSVNTGVFCEYSPEYQISWVL